MERLVLRVGGVCVFDALTDEALGAYDRIVGLDLSDASVDGSIHKAPCGGDGTGNSPVDRAKLGLKWSLLCGRAGIPVGWAAAGADRNDQVLLEPTLADTRKRGLTLDVETLHLDRGCSDNPVLKTCERYGIIDVVRVPKRLPKTAHGRPKTLPLGMHWSIERTNSWLSNYGQLRRNTDRQPRDRLAQPSPSPCCSPPNSSTAETDGTPHNRLPAHALAEKSGLTLPCSLFSSRSEAARPEPLDPAPL